MIQMNRSYKKILRYTIVSTSWRYSIRITPLRARKSTGSILQKSASRLFAIASGCLLTGNKAGTILPFVNSMITRLRYS